MDRILNGKFFVKFGEWPLKIICSFHKESRSNQSILLKYLRQTNNLTLTGMLVFSLLFHFWVLVFSFWSLKSAIWDPEAYNMWKKIDSTLPPHHLHSPLQVLESCLKSCSCLGSSTVYIFLKSPNFVERNEDSLSSGRSKMRTPNLHQVWQRHLNQGHPSSTDHRRK